MVRHIKMGIPVILAPISVKEDEEVLHIITGQSELGARAKFSSLNQVTKTITSSFSIGLVYMYVHPRNRFRDQPSNLLCCNLVLHHYTRHVR